MMNRRKTYIILLFILCLFAGACSVDKNYRLLSFFFDGVPAPCYTEITPASDSLLLAKDDTLGNTSINVGPPVYYHTPYLEKNCNSCHNWRNMGENLGMNPALCFSCHKRFSYSYKFTHGPVSAGYCSECHLPHKSDFEHLLSKRESEICINCHTHGNISKNRYHLISDEENCLVCHNPHGSNNHLLIRSDA